MNKMHSGLLRERVKSPEVQTKKKQQTATNVTLPDAFSFQTRQSTGKAMKHAPKSLPNPPRKKMFVIAKMAIEVGLEIKGTLAKKSY